MFAAPRIRSALTRPVALVALLAITAAWTMPRSSTAGSAIVDAAASGPRVAAALSFAATARDDAFDGWAEARAQRQAPPAKSSTSSAELDARGDAAKLDTAPAKKAKEDVKSKATGASTTKKSPPSYRGTNHFWIPSLGMSYGVHWYGCSASYYPKNVIYRWGCAGTNNVYLFGHAYGVMKPLHDLYVRGGLKKGMVAVFANANGKVTKYRVTEWRVVRPTQVAWQIASQPRPSMTLQTCIGKNSEYRLNVRLVAFD
jgi:hypothetical protein